MKTNYAKQTDDELCKSRIGAFLSDLPIEDRRSMNAEFKRRFPRMMDNPNAKIIEAPDRWDDDTPSFLDDEVPEWMKRTAEAAEKKKFSLKRKSTKAPD